LYKQEAMSSIAIKEALHEYINNSDDKLLQMIYAMIREYNQQPLNDADIAELEARTMRRQKGESKSYDWQTAKDIMTGKSGISQ
jgi:hypothetical protein